MYQSVPELIDPMIAVLRRRSLNPKIVMDKLNIDKTFKAGYEIYLNQ